MLYRGRRYINTCFVSVFRQLFKNHPQFPWVKEFLDTKIYIDVINYIKIEKFYQEKRFKFYLNLRLLTNRSIF